MESERVEKAIADYASDYYDALPDFLSPFTQPATSGDVRPAFLTNVYFNVTMKNIVDKLWMAEVTGAVATPRSTGEITRHREVCGVSGSQGLWASTAENITDLSTKLELEGISTSGWFVQDEKAQNNNDHFVSFIAIRLRLEFL